MANNKLTNSTTETSFGSLLKRTFIFSIPYFQRGYKWKEKDRKLLLDDINQILNKEEDVHFLGTIITYKKLTGSTEFEIYEVIDGQQRIITLYLHILATIEIYIRYKHFADAVRLFQNLVLPGDTDHPSNFKLYSSRDDRLQFNTIVRRIFNNKNFNKQYGDYNLKLLPDAGKPSGNISKMYSKVKSSINTFYGDSGLQKLKEIIDVIFSNLHFIDIMLNDASNSTKFFERVNSRGITVTTGELVRNEVFSRVVGQDDSIVNDIYRNSWLPFFEKFKDPNQFDEYLFAFTLIKSPTCTKQRVFEYLRNRWKEHGEPEAIILDLYTYQDIYLQLKLDSNGAMPVNILQLPKSTYDLVINYIKSNTPTTVLPFIMRLLFEFRANNVDTKTTNGVLIAIDSYLTRRAVMGIEPTGLHAIFKGLYPKLEKNMTVKTVVEKIKETKTMVWPSDKEFKDAINNRDLYESRISRYLIDEHNRSFGGDVPKEKFEIEHILPKKYNNWWKAFTLEEHKTSANKLANLMAISPEINKKIGNASYEKKKPYYMKSKYFVCRELVKNYPEWNPEAFEKRTEEIVKWALKRWPY